MLLVSLVHQLVPHWSPISCVLPSPGRSGPSRAEVGVGFRCVRLVQALPSSPPPLVLFRVRRPSAFLFPCVFSLFFCVPLFAFWLSNLSFIFMFISPSFPLHLLLHLICTNTTLPKAECVCVCNVCIDVKNFAHSSFYNTYILMQGVTGVPGGSVTNEDTSPGPV